MKTKHTVFEAMFVVAGQAYEVELRYEPRAAWDRRAPKHTRAFVWTKPLDVLQDLADRASEARYAAAARKAERTVLDAALACIPFVGAAPASYSRTAGCGCGCSPGFVLRSLPCDATIFVNPKEV